MNARKPSKMLFVTGALLGASLLSAVTLAAAPAKNGAKKDAKAETISKKAEVLFNFADKDKNGVLEKDEIALLPKITGTAVRDLTRKGIIGAMQPLGPFQKIADLKAGDEVTRADFADWFHQTIVNADSELRAVRIRKVHNPGPQPIARAGGPRGHHIDHDPMDRLTSDQADQIRRDQMIRDQFENARDNKARETAMGGKLGGEQSGMGHGGGNRGGGGGGGGGSPKGGGGGGGSKDSGSSSSGGAKGGSLEHGKGAKGGK